MNEITLMLIVFFALYNGVDSKIKHKKFLQAMEWVDKQSRLFIKNFAFKSNVELFEYLYSINKKLFIPLLILSSILFKLNVLTGVISLVFVFSIVSHAILINKEESKKEFKEVLKFWGLGLLSILFFVFLSWLDKDLIGYDITNQLSVEFINVFKDGAENMGVKISTFLGVMIVGVLFLFLFYYTIRFILKKIVWCTFLVLKCYAKFCFSLNKRQPLKPFYLLTKTVIIIVSYGLAKISGL